MSDRSADDRAAADTCRSAPDVDIRLAAAMAKLTAQAHHTNRSRVAELASALADLDGGDLDSDRRASALRSAHQLAGSAGTFGMDRASRLAGRLESYLSDIQAGDETRLSEAHAVLSELQQELGPASPAPPPADPPGSDLDR